VEDSDDMKAHGNVVDHEYLINNHSHLHANPDGSGDLDVQHDGPSDRHRRASGCPRLQPASDSG
jgi:hypothetical protein